MAERHRQAPCRSSDGYRTGLPAEQYRAIALFSELQLPTSSPGCERRRFCGVEPASRRQHAPIALTPTIAEMPISLPMFAAISLPDGRISKSYLFRAEKRVYLLSTLKR